MSARIALLLIVVVLGACERRDQFAVPDTATVAPPPAARSAYLSVSSLSPAANGSVVVAGTIATGNALTLGSFRVRLAYDTARLRYRGEIEEPGMMRVVNAQPGEIIVTGASSGASTDGRLFLVRFDVVDPTGLNSLVLRLDEVNDANFENQTATILRASALRVDSTLTGGLVPR